MSTTRCPHRQLLDVIEQEFGVNWLRRKAGLRVSKHWVPAAWREATAAVQQIELTKKLDLTLSMIRLFDLAADLKDARELKGYSTAINPAKLKGGEFEKAAYAAHIAALSVRSEYEVEFIPTSDTPSVKTADLRLHKQKQQFEIECKRKEPATAPNWPDPMWDKLDNALSPLSAGADESYEITVIVVGQLRDEHIPPVVWLVKSVLAKRDEGVYTSGDVSDCAVLIRRAPPGPPGLIGVWIPASQNPASAHATVRVGADGAAVCGPMFRTTLYAIRSHRLSQLLASFNTARKQLSDKSPGAIYIDVDGSAIRPGDHKLYFDLMAQWLARQFTPSQNTRIGAVVLTSGPEIIDVPPGTNWHRTARFIRIVRNPYAAVQLNSLLPGEAVSPAP